MVIKPKFETVSANFIGNDGRPYLVRCPVCQRENWALAVASGECAWCGWDAKDAKENQSA